MTINILNLQTDVGIQGCDAPAHRVDLKKTYWVKRCTGKQLPWELW